MDAQDIVIVGSGMAGYTLAREIRKIDKSVTVTVVTADDGAAYSKPMLSNALAQGKAPAQLVQKPAERMAEDLAVAVRTHTRVTAVDRDTKTLRLETPAGDTRLAYGRLVLATGARPRPYTVPGGDTVPLHAVNSLDDYRRWRGALRDGDRVLIVGAGLIGVEFANDLALAGHAVTVVDPAPRPLGRLLPEALGPLVADALEDAGITLELGQTVVDVANGGDMDFATLDSGKRVAFDRGLVAIGLVPNIDLAVRAGLETDAGIRVDTTLRTSDPDIFALGDCAQTAAGVLPFVLPLMAEARALAATLTGTETPLHLPALPVTVKTPALPLVVCPPPAGAQGTWSLDGDGTDRRAVFADAAGATLGFVLTGAATKERMALSKAVPDLLAA